jgi:hypothetical protein
MTMVQDDLSMAMPSLILQVLLNYSSNINNNSHKLQIPSFTSVNKKQLYKKTRQRNKVLKDKNKRLDPFTAGYILITLPLYEDLVAEENNAFLFSIFVIQRVYIYNPTLS